MALLGDLGGGFGEEPVRIGDLEAAARQASVDRQAPPPMWQGRWRTGPADRRPWTRPPPHRPPFSRP
jgi:hypothetical protein